MKVVVLMSFVVACVLLVQSGIEARPNRRGRGGGRRGEQRMKAEIQELIANITVNCGEGYVDQLEEKLNDEWSEMCDTKSNSKSSSEEDDDDDGSGDDNDDDKQKRPKRFGRRQGDCENSMEYLKFQRDFFEDYQECEEIPTSSHQPTDSTTSAWFK
ncbi:uncharacterized protein [Watersipora subatra]|uniref:uncharacterized protein n=1 Tax=Watersipora subatra TaxID=2589382 RepID=UPI00355C6957